MAVSRFMEQLIRESLDDMENQNEPRNMDRVTYTITTDDRRVEQNVAQAVFRLSKPVPAEELGPKGRNVLQHVSEFLDARRLGIADALLAQYGLQDRVGRKRTRGNVAVRLGTRSDEDLGSAAINSRSGRFISNTNLRSILELVAKNYLIQDMRRPSAALKFRTGRFANSLNVTRVGIVDGDAGRRQRVSIFYTYMTRPYAVFDPMVSTRPELYNRPTPGARNPQVLIGDAIAKAARDVIHSRYRLDVRQDGR